MKKYVILLSVIMLGATAQAKRITFSDGDKNGDGFISIEEFEAAHKIANPKFDKQALTKMFGRKDKDKDGKISPDEFGGERK